MAFYIEKMIFHNRAPFKHLELNFKDKDIILLNAVNGGGKTTVLSHIADAFYELAPFIFNKFQLSRCCIRTAFLRRSIFRSVQGR